MIEAFYSSSGGVPTGILIDQPGTYLVLSTLGITVAACYASASTGPGAVVKRMETFLPLITLVVALGILLSFVTLPLWYAVLRPV
jgi:hypothetical protein